MINFLCLSVEKFFMARSTSNRERLDVCILYASCCNCSAERMKCQIMKSREL